MASTVYEVEVQKLLKDKSLLHLISGLASEAGEVCAEVQKACYKGFDIHVENIKSELGDVLFYVAALANHFGTNMHELQLENIYKLKLRHGENNGTR